MGREEKAMQEKSGAWPLESKVYRFAEMNLRRNPNGSESRDFGGGALATGELVRLHESMQVAGLPPNPAHTIAHTEFICIREGTLEFMHDGHTEIAEAGDVLFVAKGSLHQVRNLGKGPASYFVLAVGGDT
jgi:ethanolamine utilization protein EutQ (cupin superfamily)